MSLSPATPPPSITNPPPAPPPSGGGVKIAILFGAVIALLAATVYLFYQLNTVQKDLTATKDSMLNEIAKIRETASVTTQTNRRTTEILKDELEAARRQANAAVGQAKIDATKHADELAAALKVEQQKQLQKVNAEVSQVKEAATTANTKIGEVNTEVGNVKSDVAATKSELEKTIAQLRTTQGDLGLQSGLIATNAKELQALKTLGERNIFEFKLAKAKAPQKVGDIAVLLKKTDPKKNKYTIEVVADDKTVEKKDRNINEPIQFYVSKARQPYEIVVNTVSKDIIVGYLATPKVQATRD